MKKWIVRFLLIAMTFAVINDLGRYLIGMYTLDRTGRAAAFEAGQVARGSNPAANSGWPTAWQIAQENGIEFVTYGQDQTGVTAVARIWVGGTFVIGPIHAALTKQPLNSPFPMEQTFRSSK